MSQLQSFEEASPFLRERIERVLETWLPETSVEPKDLHSAMRYSTLDAGKRIRPILVYATGYCTGQDLAQLDGPAAAIELIHVYSLIHDDLPCMDDDELRRGKPTCHIQFGDATATLAGDALQALAFQIIAEDPHSSDDSTVKVQMMKLLSKASGSLGMAGGQAIDLAATNVTLPIEDLENMHRLKTGKLISACIDIACANKPDIDEQQLKGLRQYGSDIGLAFQVRDDVIDVISDTETLGKAARADQDLNKPTFPSVIGLDASIKKAEQLRHSALAALDCFGNEAALLREIANFIVSRQY